VMFIGVATTGDYSTSRGTCPANGATLAAGSSCTLNVTFAPSATGTRTGTLSLTNDATQLPLTVSLTGNAIQAQLQITPGALAFGNIDVSYPATLTLTLLNTGSASITGITNAITGLNAADFAVSAPCSTTTLAPNQGCTETVTFTPSTTGQRLASLSVVSSDPNSPAVIPLSGTGIQAGSFLLTVNGGSSATATVSKGQPAVYDLLATPSGGFAGNIALTCAPVIAAQYGRCRSAAAHSTRRPRSTPSPASTSPAAAFWLRSCCYRSPGSGAGSCVPLTLPAVCWCWCSADQSVVEAPRTATPASSTRQPERISTR
jgi:hypothetical protein